MYLTGLNRFRNCCCCAKNLSRHGSYQFLFQAQTPLHAETVHFPPLTASNTKVSFCRPLSPSSLSHVILIPPFPVKKLIIQGAFAQRQKACDPLKCDYSLLSFYQSGNIPPAHFSCDAGTAKPNLESPPTQGQKERKWEERMHT